MHEKNLDEVYQKGYETGLWDTATFIAEVIKAEGNIFHVRRCEAYNQLEYVFNIGTENALIMSEGKVIDVSEIKEGDIISVTFYGEIVESSPIFITGVIRVVVRNLLI